MMQDETQQGALSEEDAEFDNDDEIPNRTAVTTMQNEDEEANEDQDEDMEDAEGEDDAEYEEDDTVAVEDCDEDVPGHEEDEDNDAESEDRDVKADEDNNMTLRTRVRSVDAKGGAEEEEEEEGDDEGDDEGVGAVKIKPGETDDEESDSAESDNDSGDESDGSAAWEEPVDNEDEEDEEDDISKAESLTLCMFCKNSDREDPGEELEATLICIGCGENAHRQCARQQKAFKERSDTSKWKCLECIGDDVAMASGDSDGDDMVDAGLLHEEISPPLTRRSNASQLEADLLPAQRGARPDSHSVFNQLVVDGDPMDGSRTLRKRKTSPADAEAEEVGMSLRKRRRNVTVEAPPASSAGDTKTPSRSLRLKISTVGSSVTVEKRSRSKLILTFRVNAASLGQVLAKSPKPKKRARSGARSSRSGARRGGGGRGRASEVGPPLVATGFTQPFYGFFDREADEMKGKPYGGILTEAEADTTKTLPTSDDRRRFDEAKQKAEEEWRARLQEMQAEACIPSAGKKPKKNVGPASQIECIQFGGWEIDTWYAAPYPEEYCRNRVLYICEFCLKYMNSDYVAWRHKLKCPVKHPPGDEIYRKGPISFFEVDGRKNPVYCQNLCLLAKLFLGSKTLYYDVEPFLFYILCEYDDHGYHFVGYFSKEKRASSQNNVSCILTLPIHQRKGFGNLLIDFSYLLTRVEDKTGSPEKPLSDMGLVSYRNYWRLILCRYLLGVFSEDESVRRGLSIKKISGDTGLTPDDVISALEGLRFLVRDPVTGIYAFRIDFEFCREAVGKWESKEYVTIDEEYLTWTPYVMGRGNCNTFELGPALNNLAPREDEEAQADDLRAVREEPSSKVDNIPNGTTPSAAGSEVIVTDSMDLDLKPPRTENACTNGDVVSVSAGEAPPAADLTSAAAPQSSIGEERQQAVDGSDEGWLCKYDGIAPTRFQVFPPINSRREGRSRGTLSRANSNTNAGAVRTPSSSSRPRTAKRRLATSSRRSSGVSKPKARSSAARRKTGGTGRGPGRWPKGTKKSDYGNAESGPGFPPGWFERMGIEKPNSPSKPRSKANSNGTLAASTPKRRPSASSDSVASSAIDYHTRTNGRMAAKQTAVDDTPIPIVTSDIKSTGEEDG